MKLYTGNFANVKKYREAGIFPVSISCYAKYYEGAKYPKLSPNYSWLHLPPGEYTEKFKGLLKPINPVTVLNELEVLSKGKDVVLLCHEPEGEFCHRQLVAKWFILNLRIEVKELGKMEKPKDAEQIKLF